MPTNSKAGSVRIIGGTWRGKKLPFPADLGVRPTADRVKETLFNWLMHDIQGARCLDLFAGSGNLGLEALSRGAVWVDFVELNPTLSSQLQKTLDALSIIHAGIYTTNAQKWLARPSKPYDIVFLDPPFNESLIKPLCQLLENQAHIHDETLIYIECEKTCSPIPIPQSWHILKEKTAGDVRYALAKRQTA